MTRDLMLINKLRFEVGYQKLKNVNEFEMAAVLRQKNCRLLNRKKLETLKAHRELNSSSLGIVLDKKSLLGVVCGLRKSIFFACVDGCRIRSKECWFTRLRASKLTLF